jgi:SIR2-like domain
MNRPEALADTPIVFLTGAGASIPLGLPATKQFLAQFRESLSPAWLSEGGPDFGPFVWARLANADSDIEEVLGSLEEKCQAITLLLQDRLFVQNALGGNPAILANYLQMANRLSEAIYDAVIRIYGDIDEALAEALYAGLLGHYMKFFRHLCGGRPTVPFFTLNYDTAVEAATAGLGIPRTDGIMELPRATERRWSPTAYTSYSPPAREENDLDRISVVLVKLHGSVRLLRRDDPSGPTFIEAPRGLARNPVPHTHVVIYPSLLPKPTANEPFRTGYRLLRAVLTSTNTYCLVVIGCSFRDTEVNEVLRDALDDNANLRLVAVDPALDHRDVARSLKCEPRRIRVLSMPFAPETPDELAQGKGGVLLDDLRYWVGQAVGELPQDPEFGGTYGPRRRQ